MWHLKVSISQRKYILLRMNHAKSVAWVVRIAHMLSLWALHPQPIYDKQLNILNFAHLGSLWTLYMTLLETSLFCLFWLLCSYPYRLQDKRWIRPRILGLIHLLIYIHSSQFHQLKNKIARLALHSIITWDRVHVFVNMSCKTESEQ